MKAILPHFEQNGVGYVLAATNGSTAVYKSIGDDRRRIERVLVRAAASKPKVEVRR